MEITEDVLRCLRPTLMYHKLISVVAARGSDLDQPQTVCIDFWILVVKLLFFAHLSQSKPKVNPEDIL